MNLRNGDLRSENENLQINLNDKYVTILIYLKLNL